MKLISATFLDKSGKRRLVHTHRHSHSVAETPVSQWSCSHFHQSSHHNLQINIIILNTELEKYHKVKKIKVDYKFLKILLDGMDSVTCGQWSYEHTRKLTFINVVNAQI